MKKVIFILFSAVLFISCNKSTQTAENSSQLPNYEGDVVEVLYFHGKERCNTCKAIEKETKLVIDSIFSNEVSEEKVVFKVIDISQKENELLAEKYEIAWSSLLVNDWNNGEEISNNMTDFALANARIKPDNFKTELQRAINEALTN